MKCISLFLKSICCLLVFLIPLPACAQGVYNGPTLIIGDLEWMAENLNTIVYWDGVPIPEAKTREQWQSCNERKIGCYCNYDNEDCYGKMYGKLYNWYAIRRGVVPHCWRMATKADYDNLLRHTGDAQAGKKLKSTHSWNNEWNGTNTYKFNGLAAGCRNANGTFSYVGRKTFWWTKDARKTGASETGLVLSLDSDDKLSYDVTDGCGFSVRCVRNNEPPRPMPCP